MSRLAKPKSSDDALDEVFLVVAASIDRVATTAKIPGFQPLDQAVFNAAVDTDIPSRLNPGTMVNLTEAFKKRLDNKPPKYKGDPNNWNKPGDGDNVRRLADLAGVLAFSNALQDARLAVNDTDLVAAIKTAQRICPHPTGEGKVYIEGFYCDY